MASKSLAFHSLFITYTFLMVIIMIINIKPSTSSPPFEFLKHLQGGKKGDNIQGIRDLKNYLQHFGYLPSKHTKTQTQTHSLVDHDHHHDDRDDQNDDFDDVLESAIKTYQINYNLKPTGTLDTKTLFNMMKPRCGVADIVNNNITRMRSGKKRVQAQPHHKHHYHTVSHYSFFPGKPKWPAAKSTLTYGFLPGTPQDASAAVGRAFNTWASNTSFSFVKAQDYAKADIRVSFERGNHGDGDSFDGSGGVLAHAFSPTDGRLHFDADETWAIGEVPGAYDVETVALHEIGHLLGLLHSSVEGAIMFPQIGAGSTKGLNGDDIQGINALYNVVV